MPPALVWSRCFAHGWSSLNAVLVHLELAALGRQPPSPAESHPSPSGEARGFPQAARHFPRALINSARPRENLAFQVHNNNKNNTAAPVGLASSSGRTMARLCGGQLSPLSPARPQASPRAHLAPLTPSASHTPLGAAGPTELGTQRPGSSGHQLEQAAPSQPDVAAARIGCTLCACGCGRGFGGAGRPARALTGRRTGSSSKINPLLSLSLSRSLGRLDWQVCTKH